MCRRLCGRLSACASLCVAGPMWGEPLPRNVGGKVGLQEKGSERLFTAVLGGAVSAGCLGTVHPFHQQVVVHVCAMYGCERDGVCAKTGVRGLRSVYASAEGSSGVCTAGRQVKPLCEASSVPVATGEKHADDC